MNEPRLSDVRSQILEKHFSQLLSNINEPQLEVFQAGGIPTTLHEEYPEY